MSQRRMLRPGEAGKLARASQLLSDEARFQTHTVWLQSLNSGRTRGAKPDAGTRVRKVRQGEGRLTRPADACCGGRSQGDAFLFILSSWRWAVPFSERGRAGGRELRVCSGQAKREKRSLRPGRARTVDSEDSVGGAGRERACHLLGRQ